MPTFSTSVKCPFCGADGQEYQVNCTKCGKELPKEQKLDPLTGTQGKSATKMCPNCGRPMSIYSTMCDYCNRPEVDYLEDSSGGVYTSESQLPVVGGVLILIAGVLGFFEGLVTLATASEVASWGYEVPGSVTCCAGLMIIFGVIAAAGGFSAMGRKSVVFAIVGGIFGILSVGFLIGALLSLIGIILVAIAHNEFAE